MGVIGGGKLVLITRWAGHMPNRSQVSPFHHLMPAALWCRLKSNPLEFRVRLESDCHLNGDQRVKYFAYMVLCLTFSGCVTDSPAVHRDDTAKVRSLGEERAHKDLGCPSAKAGRPVRSVRMSDWGEPLYTEYRSWVEGCGKHVTYVIACHDDDECQFADTLSVYPE